MIRASLACLCLAALALPAAAQDLSGQYTVKRTFDGWSSEGTAEIRMTSNTTCEISWVTAGRESVGICMPNGNALAAAYVMEDVVGLVIYRVQDDGTLNGVWTIAGQRGRGTDVLTPAN